MVDILDYVEVVVPPAYSCDEFEVAASVILECQDFLALGCPGVAPYELAPLYFASLANHHSLVELRSDWLRLCEDAIEQVAAASEERAPRSLH